MSGETVVVPKGAAETFEPIDAPHYAVSSSQIFGLGSEFAIAFAAPRMGELTIDGESQHVARNEAVAVVVLSPGTLKDLTLLTARLVEAHEAEWGVIETPYTKRRAKEIAEEHEAAAKPARRKKK